MCFQWCLRSIRRKWATFSSFSRSLHRIRNFNAIGLFEWAICWKRPHSSDWRNRTPSSGQTLYYLSFERLVHFSPTLLGMPYPRYLLWNMRLCSRSWPRPPCYFAKGCCFRARGKPPGQPPDLETCRLSPMRQRSYPWDRHIWYFFWVFLVFLALLQSLRNDAYWQGFLPKMDARWLVHRGGWACCPSFALRAFCHHGVTKLRIPGFWRTVYKVFCPWIAY